MLPASLLLLLALGSHPCLKWRHAVNPSSVDDQRVRASVAVIESGDSLQEVVALLANGSLISYSISISGAVGPSVDLGGPAAAAPVVLGASTITHQAAVPRTREACPSASTELVAVLVGGNLTLVNAANMAKCWSTRLVPSKIGSNMVPFSSGLALVHPGVLVAALPAASSRTSRDAGSRAAREVEVAGLRTRDGLVLWRKTVPGGPQVLETVLPQRQAASSSANILVSGKYHIFVATPGPASVVTALALSSNSSQQPTVEWSWTAPHSSSVLAMQPLGDKQLAVGLSSGAVILLNSSLGAAATVWNVDVSSGGMATSLTLAPEGWGTSLHNSSVLLVSTNEAVADRSQPQRGQIVALSVVHGGVLWTAAAPTAQAPRTAAGGCAPSAVSIHVPRPSSGSQAYSALLNGTTAVFGCPDSIHAVSNVGEVVWSLPLQQGIDSLAIGDQDGVIYGWSQGVTSIDASCRNSSDLQLCPASSTSHPPCSCHKSCTACVDAACAWVNDGDVNIQFWDSSTQKLRTTTRSHMHFCWRGNMFTLSQSRTLHAGNRTISVHTDYAPQYGQCSVNATFAVTFAVTVVFLLVCVTYVSFHLHFSTFGKNTLQKHYDGMVTPDFTGTEYDSEDSEVASDIDAASRWHDVDEPTLDRESPPDSLITRLLEPGIPRDMGGQTSTITEDEAMFLLQKRLVVRQYKYVLYLQQMTYVLVLVLFYLNAVWIKIFPDAFLGPTVLAPVSVVALRSESQKWVNIAFYSECFSIFMRLYSTFSLVFIGMNCVLMSPGGCSAPAAFTTVFSVPFFVLAWYDLGFHVAAVYINRDLYKLVMINKVTPGSVQTSNET